MTYKEGYYVAAFKYRPKINHDHEETCKHDEKYDHVLMQSTESVKVLSQEPMSRSMQLHYIPVTAFSFELFLDRIYLEWHSHGSAIINHKTLIDVTASLDRNGLSFTEEKVY